MTERGSIDFRSSPLPSHSPRPLLVVEYALRDVKKPIGVAEWRTRLVESLPNKLQSSLPTVAEIEAELTGGLARGQTRKARKPGRKRK